MQFRFVEILLNPYIGHSRNLLNFGEQPGCESSIGFEIVTDHLNVHRRRQSEIQNLADDIRRWEIEKDTGEVLIQFKPEIMNVPLGRTMTVFQRYLNVRVLGA